MKKAFKNRSLKAFGLSNGLSESNNLLKPLWMLDSPSIQVISFPGLFPGFHFGTRPFESSQADLTAQITGNKTSEEKYLFLKPVVCRPLLMRH